MPVVLTTEEVRATLGQMVGTSKLMAELIYGAGLRVHECVSLRIKDIDLSAKVVSIRNSKGSKDRTTVLPERLVSPLQQHLLRVAALHRDDLASGAGLAPMPDALDMKYPSASASLAWQYVFPSSVLRPWGSSGRKVRWHVSDSTIQRAFKQAIDRAEVMKHARHPLSTPQFCDALAGCGNGHQDNSIAFGSSKSSDDHDLHPRDAGNPIRHEPIRFTLIASGVHERLLSDENLKVRSWPIM